MSRANDLYKLPEDLPVPEDDGACDHLTETRLPALGLLSTAGETVDLSALAGRTVVYCYPRTGDPKKKRSAGWNEIPGARGCTPQSCAFRDHYQELKALGAGVYGLSAQATADQREARDRLHLPFELLSDEKLAFANALCLPVFEFGGMTLLKRLTLIVQEGGIEKVFYPVFPPDENPGQVIHWLSENRI